MQPLRKVLHPGNPNCFNSCINLLPTSRRNINCGYEPQPISKQRSDHEQVRHQSVLQQLSPASTAWPSTATAASSLTPVDQSKRLNGDFPNQTTDFPSVRFLDSKLTRQYHVKIPETALRTPPHVLSLIGDITYQLATAKSFFDNIHNWMPIISKKGFYEHINPLCPLRADYALLVLCMDLISWLPSSDLQDARTPTYLAAKRYYLDLEISGVFSIQALQAGVLIAIFEVGHAIYPSAYLSVAACARYGAALGIDWNTPSILERPYCWVEAEEHNRVWWSIILLDRYVASSPTKCYEISTWPPSLEIVRMLDSKSQQTLIHEAGL